MIDLAAPSFSLRTMRICALVSVVLSAACFHTERPLSVTNASASTAARDDARGIEDALAPVLSAVVDDDGRVDYGALARDRAMLDDVVARIGASGPTTAPERFVTRDEKLAFYLNAYNALVLFNVVNRWPNITNIDDIKYDFFYFSRFVVDGSPINLYDLENDVIRDGFREPRVHFALNCASVGCPKLPNVPFRAASLDDDLARETSRFLAEPRNCTIGKDGSPRVSSVFEWFPEDFPPDPVTWLAANGCRGFSGRPLRFSTWDWALNVQSTSTNAR